MRTRKPSEWGLSLATVILSAAALPPLPPAAAQQPLAISVVAEKTVRALPDGPVLWRLETFRDLDRARAAAGPTGLVAQVDGTVWLFTLGPAGHVSAGATGVAELGPLPPLLATRHGRPAALFRLMIHEVRGAPGSLTPVGSHPGPQALYVLAGEASETTPRGIARAAAGQTMVGPARDVSMQLASSGTTDLHALMLSVVDAARPAWSPGALAGRGCNLASMPDAHDC